MATAEPTTQPSSSASPAVLAQRNARGTHGFAFGPNLASVDYVELFRRPESWSELRDTLSAFMIFGGNIRADPETAGLFGVGPNTYGALADAGVFRLLKSWGLPLHVEAEATKEHDHDATNAARVAAELVARVRAAGGEIAVICMDEPLASTIRSAEDDDPTKLTVERAGDVARWTADFGRTVERLGPRVALLEAYPYHPPELIEAFLRNVVVDNAFPLAFLELDIDIGHVDNHDFSDRRVRTDLRRLKTACAELGVPFRAIATGTHAKSADTYRAETLRIARLLGKHVAPLAGVTVKSWVEHEHRREIPANLPARSPTSHLGVLRDVRALKLVESQGAGPRRQGALQRLLDALFG